MLDWPPRSQTKGEIKEKKNKKWKNERSDQKGKGAQTLELDVFVSHRLDIESNGYLKGGGENLS